MKGQCGDGFHLTGNIFAFSSLSVKGEYRMLTRHQPGTHMKGDVTGRLIRGSFVGLLASTIVRVIYSDESGLGSIEKEPFTIVTAVMVNMESQWEPLEAELTQIAYASSRRALRHGSEFHGRRLLQQARAGKNRAGEILGRITDAVSRHHIPIFVGSVDRVGLKNYQSPLLPEPQSREKKTAHTVAFETCLEKIDTYVRKTIPHERLLWIADRSSYERELKAGLTRFRYLENFGGLFREDEYPRTNPIHVVDTMYFGDSAESLALQLVDVCCSIITLGLKAMYYEKPRSVPPLFEFFEKISPQLVAGHGPPRFMFYRKPRTAGEPGDDDIL